MKIRLDTLRRFVDLPADPKAARLLLDEVGIEVKRYDASVPGVQLTLELLANRGDHHAYAGIAREVSGRTGAALRLPPSLPLVVGPSPHPIVLDAPDLCPVYTLTRLVRAGDRPLDADALALLESCGLQSRGAVIDATNVANLELGQPTHAFDAASIRGPVTVRRARAGERAWPLFAPGQVEVPEGALVIADDEKILAIAGVIGCEESKTTAATEVVLLESAAFDPVAVRKASRALGIHTDSSARFERGSDFALPLTGAGRVAALLGAAGWRVDGPTGRVGAWQDPGRVIQIDPDAARRFLAIDAPDAEIIARLERYGFLVGPGGRVDARTGELVHAERLAARVPTWRLHDVVFVQDLYEELARSFGYDDTPAGLPLIDLGALPSHGERVRAAVDEVFVGHGFYEVITDGFYSRALRERLGIGEGHPLWAHVETANALDRAYSLLKNSCFGQALECVALNQNVGAGDAKAYELTTTFHPDPAAANGVCAERRVLWAIASGHEREPGWAGVGRPFDVHAMRGLVQAIGRALGLPLSFGPLADGGHLAGLVHPFRGAAVRLDGAVVGAVGEVHPALVTGWKLRRARPIYLELDWTPAAAPAGRP
ncbi:MAG TPA: phenylalanine--tRNA ligase beta subunit-related protein [Myxococcota bacterium]|nr:phenylalanine--tRNA ligase beta subunit-related protein [Myxococcota bacterium]